MGLGIFHFLVIQQHQLQEHSAQIHKVQDLVRQHLDKRLHLVHRVCIGLLFSFWFYLQIGFHIYNFFVAFGGAPTAATGPVSAAPAFGFNTPATNANTGFAFGQLNQQQATGLGAFGTGGTTGAGFGTGLGTSFGGGGFGAQPPAATSGE